MEKIINVLLMYYLWYHLILIINFLVFDILKNIG